MRADRGLHGRPGWELLYLGYCWEHCSPTASRSAKRLAYGGYVRDAAPLAGTMRSGRNASMSSTYAHVTVPMCVHTHACGRPHHLA